MSNRYRNYLKKLTAEMNTASVNIAKIPPKDKQQAHYPVYDFNIKQQADLLELPNDNQYKYLLVLIDFKRYAAAEALKTKNASEVLEAFKTIYKRDDNLEHPMALHTDGGSEFTNKEVVKYFASHYTTMRVSKPGRSRQNALVENFNKLFRTLYNIIANQSELQTHKRHKDWRQYVEPILKMYNENNQNRLKSYNSKIEKKPYPVCKGETCKLLDEGQKVRIKLDVPIQAHDRTNQTTKKFRAGDIRYSPKVYTIEKLVLHATQPPLYQVKEKHNTLYTRGQLQIVEDDEKDDITPKPETLEKGVYEIEKIIDKRKKKTIEYLVKWKGHSTPTWETRKHVMSELGSVNFKILLDDYEDNK